MSQENPNNTPDTRAYSPRAIRFWGFLAIISASVVASAVTIRAGLGRVDQWIVGDWLIDYSAGFTRRGLIGEVVRQAEMVIGADRIIVTTLIQLSVLVALTVFLLMLVYRHQRGLATLLLVASPAFVLFLLNPLGTMRKEIVLWLLVAGVLVWSRSRRPRAGKAIAWAVASIFPVLVLIHEAMLFYAGFIVVMMWLLVSEGTVAKRTAWWAGAVGGLFTAIAAGLTLLWPTRPGIGADICATLTGAGYGDALCTGAIRFLDQDAVFSMNRVGEAISEGNYLAVYLPVILLSSLPFFFVRWSKSLAVALSLSLVMTLPLFIVAIDWGRWIVISVWLVTMLVLRFDGSPHVTVIQLEKTTKRRLGLATPLGVAAFATLWSVPHCCEPRIGFGLVDRFREVLVILGLW